MGACPQLRTNYRMSFRTPSAMRDLLFAGSAGTAEESRFLTADRTRNDISRHLGVPWRPLGCVAGRLSLV